MTHPARVAAAAIEATVPGGCWRCVYRAMPPGLSWVEQAEEDQPRDRAGNDLVGGVGSGALHVEAAECLEQLQSGDNEQRLPRLRMRLRRVLGRRSPWPCWARARWRPC
jgi:hypothetical protein